ncbi:MAG: M13 family metallopeptidase [Hyphomonadaceae bacterium]|nr:M13 family metallopeptidase [Hyphomonadaceae bacterium]
MAARLPHRLLEVAAAAAILLVACASPPATDQQPGLTPAEKHALAQLLPEENLPGFQSARLRSQEPADGEKTTPGQDFYSYVNSEWLASYQLPPDKLSIGAAEELTEKSDADVREMIEDIIVTNPAPGTLERKIADLYSAAMDEQAIEARGIAPLQPHLDRIRAVKTRDELVRLMGVIGYNSPIGIGVAPSPADPDTNAVWLSQAGLGMPHRGYYISFGMEDESLRLAYRAHVINVLRLIGAPDPADGALRIYSLERNIARAHTDEDRSISAEDALRTMSMAELKAYAPGFGWDAFLGEGGFTNADRFVVTDQTAVADLAKLIPTLALEDWKLWMEFHFANQFAEYLPKKFADSHFGFFSRRLGGLEEKPPRWQWAVSIVNAYLGEGVGELYVKRNFSSSYKDDVDAIVANIRTAFAARLKRLDWMDEETRLAALGKLDALKQQIGHPDVWKDYSGLKVEQGKLFEAIYGAFEYTWDEQRADLHKPVDRSRWPTPAHIVNAFYNPLANTFTMPAGILQPPYFDPDADAAENYGGIGAVIGHEISHGFDDRGRQFDSDGRNRNWWTAQTDKRFVTKSEALIEQYDAYCPWADTCVNGLGTLGENIGDLAGLEIAYAAWKLSLGGKPAPVIDGLTGDQRFFLAYARSYRGKMRDELAQAMLEGDSHAPNRYRVNGVVRNMDAWYAAFNIVPGDKLYLPPEERVRLW